MYRLAICDNDQESVREVQKLISVYFTENGLDFNVSCFTNGQKLLEETTEFDIVFLETSVNDISGINLGKKIQEKIRKVKIIYITNQKDYLFHAINYVHAFAYLEKPIMKQVFYEQLEEVLLEISYEEPYLTFLTLDYGYVKLSTEEIYYCWYHDRKVEIVTGTKRYLCQEKINNLAQRLEKFGFVLSHQSYIVNLIHVESVMGYEITMVNQDLIPIAQKRSSNFRKKLMELAKKR